MSNKLKLEDVAFFSHEHPRNTVKQLLSGQGKWTCPANARIDTMEAELSLPAPRQLCGVDVGNFWAATIEVQVGMAEWPQSKREVLLKEQIIMNRLDCSVGDNKQKMMFFKESQLNAEVVKKKWDRVKIVIKQPFKINNDCFGLAMFVLHGIKEEDGNSSLVNRSLPSSTSSFSSVTPKENRIGLLDFKKKADSMISAPKSPYVPSVLKSLENTKRLSKDAEKDTAVDSGMGNMSSFSSKSMSRTAKMVVEGQSISGKKVSFEDEAKYFLKSCGFDKQPFAEVEMITFRKVKELWMEKKKCNLSKDEKEILKKMSTMYLTRLVNNSNKRQRETSDETSPPKKRKISKNVETMRKTIKIDDLYGEDEKEGSNNRNKIATNDVPKKPNSDSEEDEDIKKIKDNIRMKVRNDKVNQLASSKKDVSTMKKINNDLPTFDLTSSPDVSPVKQTSVSSESQTCGSKDTFKNTEISPLTLDIDSAVKKPSVDITSSHVKKGLSAPNYNRTHLLSVPKNILTDNGVLVQVYNYKKDKQLPLKGGLELSAKKGVATTFFKVGPDVHLEYQGRFYLPDIQPEHLERVFKSFPPHQVKSPKFPSNLDSLLKMSSSGSVKSDIKDENKDAEMHSDLNERSTSKGILKDDADDLYDDVKDAKKAFESRKEVGSSGKSSQGICPLCQGSFSLASLEDHAAQCQGPNSDHSTSVTKCPICDLEVDSEVLEEHAAQCAASRFGI